MSRSLSAVLIVLTALLSACATVPSAGERMAAASARAAAAGLKPLTLEAPELPLAGFARLGCVGRDLVIYVEGDGYAWVSSTRPSPDPTPVNPVALALASIDPGCNVVYLGRPGQYLPGRVASRYWLSARFAPEVIERYVDVIRDFARRQQAPVVHLVGFSGGGAVAALAAARLHRLGDIELTLRTVAGNLDTEAWARLLRLSPLEASLNPAAEAATLEAVPQLHLVGRQDRQVPEAVLSAFLARMSRRDCVQVLRVDARHGGPWEAAWRQALLQPPVCMAADAGAVAPARP